MDNTKTYWITKRVLTEGVIPVVATRVGDVKVDTIRQSVEFGFVYYASGEHHETRELAFVKAEQMRLDKIKSLRRQIKKLEALKFE